MKKILLLSAYDALSHRLWRQTVVEGLPQYQWTVLTLPARHFSWRIRGNALSWSMTEVEALADRYDLILATSMTDLATLKGLAPGLAAIPTMVYFHENQFDYPLRGARGALEAQMVTLYAALAADSCYAATLQRSDVVLSTALHDFQGLAVLEAAAAGNVPLVPDRLAYREWFADRFRYASCRRDIEREARAMVDKLEQYKQLKDRGRLAAPDVRNLSWAELGPLYNEAIDRLIN